MTAQGTLGLSRTFYPALQGGKFHQANKVTENALCDGSILVDVQAEVIAYSANDLFSDVHPIVCRRCMTKATGRN